MSKAFVIFSKALLGPKEPKTNGMCQDVPVNLKRLVAKKCQHFELFCEYFHNCVTIYCQPLMALEN
jgi:hypothetical protein